MEKFVFWIFDIPIRSGETHEFNESLLWLSLFQFWLVVQVSLFAWWKPAVGDYNAVISYVAAQSAASLRIPQRFQTRFGPHMHRWWGSSPECSSMQGVALCHARLKAWWGRCFRKIRVYEAAASSQTKCFRFWKTSWPLQLWEAEEKLVGKSLKAG